MFGRKGAAIDSSLFCFIKKECESVLNNCLINFKSSYVYSLIDVHYFT